MMLKAGYKYLLLVPILSLIWGIGYAFDPHQANQSLDKLSITLSVEKLSAKELEKIQRDLIEQKKQAEICVEEKAKELTVINSQLPEVKPNEDITLTADQQFLFTRKNEINDSLSACKLFSFRSNELLNAFSKEAKAIKKSFYFTRNNPLIEKLEMLPDSFSQWMHALESEDFYINIEITSYTYNDLILVAICLSIAYLISLYIKSSLLIISGHIKQKNNFEKYLSVFLHSITRRITIILLLLTLLAYESVHDYLINYDLLFDHILLMALAFFVLQIGIDFIKSPAFSKNHFKTYKKSQLKIFTFSLNAMLLILLSKYFISEIDLLLPQQEIISEFSSALYYTAVAVVFSWIVSCYLRLSAYFETSPTNKFICKSLNYLFLTSVLFTQWNGYIPLSKYILKGVIYSLSSIVITVSLYLISVSLLENIFSQKYSWQKRVFKFLHFDKNSLMLELITLKLTIFLILWGGLIVYLNDFWTISDLWSIKLREYIFSGIIIAETKVQPIRIVFSLLFFSFFTLIIKLIKHQLQPKENAINKAAQEAYLIIFGYLGVAFALLFSLLIAGVDLRGLAIIAGALSFGIGFGLQNIFNNFISGLVLLLERPIKKGDRIHVGDKEGFVTEIGVRSTHIQTLEHSHVIVPNSDLISKEVKNYMMNNKRFRIKIDIVVQYNTAPLLVKELLLKVAMNHPEVIKEGSDEPLVFCLGYYNSALNFSLWCSIDNVNNKFIVRSDIYFSIDEIFREHSIKYAFSQTELHLQEDINLQLKHENVLPTPSNPE
ncbi:MAG: mechanosensitive ion channel family protein [Candidatus Berkiella sp.]